ncbi:MAG TPA: hypothetical protein ENK86_04065 [Campylobacterales bacterium]|nr:hypothetical protein [Campylobacterales bacterium]
MKKIAFILILAFLSLQAQELTTEQLMQTYSYNHKSSLKLKHQRTLQKLAQVSQEAAYTLAQKECQGEVDTSKLMRHNKRLFYSIAMGNCSIKIDALDGSIMSKERE